MANTANIPVTAGEGEFSNNKKTILVQTQVAELMDYVKESSDLIPQSELEGKKTGKTVTVYIPDPGTTFSGLDATGHIDEGNEIEVAVTLENEGSVIELDSWNKLADIEDFNKEITRPRGRKLAHAAQKKIIDSTIYSAAQVVVADDLSLDTLSEAIAKLEEAEVVGDYVSFHKPTIGRSLSAKALGAFNDNGIAAELYKSNALGTYGSTKQVNLAQIPTVKFDSIPAISAITVVDGDRIDEVEVAGGKKGMVYKTNAKMIGVDGVETENDYFVVLASDADAHDKCKIAPITVGFNVAVEGSLTFTAAIEAGKSYVISQVRPTSALSYSAYKFGKMAGTIDSNETFDGVSVQGMEFSNGLKRESYFRLDLPYVACIPEQRAAVLIYWAV